MMFSSLAEVVTFQNNKNYPSQIIYSMYKSWKESLMCLLKAINTSFVLQKNTSTLPTQDE